MTAAVALESRVVLESRTPRRKPALENRPLISAVDIGQRSRMSWGSGAIPGSLGPGDRRRYRVSISSDEVDPIQIRIRHPDSRGPGDHPRLDTLELQLRVPPMRPTRGNMLWTSQSRADTARRQAITVRGVHCDSPGFAASRHRIAATSTRGDAVGPDTPAFSCPRASSYCCCVSWHRYHGLPHPSRVRAMCSI
jgi:hypothetical protein